VSGSSGVATAGRPGFNGVLPNDREGDGEKRMSRLYLTESGRVIPTQCEELTVFRRARKELVLPGTRGRATLYLLARSYGERAGCLHVSVNGTQLPPIEPDATGTYRWYNVPVQPLSLREGPNVIQLWAESTVMDAWSLALEAGRASEGGSWVSDDGGRSWRDGRMGYLNSVRAEYVVRLRLAEGEDPSPPAMVFEDPACVRLASLREKIPVEAQVGSGRSQMDRVRALSAWLASSWEHTGSARAAQYTPWDAETIIAWGNGRSGHNNQRPIAFCVHYAVAFVSACQAVGIAARCAALMGTPNGADGHFVAEVWFDEFGTWVMVDPNTDALYRKDGQPLSIAQIQRQGEDVADMIEWGKGTQFQRTFPHMVEFIEDNMERGLSFQHRSLWPRADFLSHPEFSPPGHGSVSYCEADFVWETAHRDGGFGMFRYFAGSDYFEAAPRG